MIMAYNEEMIMAHKGIFCHDQEKKIMVIPTLTLPLLLFCPMDDETNLHIGSKIDFDTICKDICPFFPCFRFVQWMMKQVSKSELKIDFDIICKNLYPIV